MRLLPVIVLSQFFCTSLWFAGNAVIADIARQFHLEPAYLAYLTSAVQAGFITGTLVFAIFGVSDRYSPSVVFFVCAIVAALLNLGVSVNGLNIAGLMSLRFLTGFFLAGIYPVGMKIAADHYQQGLGKSLGYLVGALVLGTAFPHLLKSFTAFPWQYVIYATSALAIAGGSAIYLLVPDGPYRRPGQQIKLTGFLGGFRNREFREAAFGYFGHMWELYAFWVFVPVMLTAFRSQHPESGLNISLLSFLIIASGGIACVLGGYLSQRIGTKRTAVAALSTSYICCIVSPVFILGDSATALIVFLLIWGMVVVADSPLFSTMVAQNAPPETKGTSLTIVNCIGFAITIVSIQLISAIRTDANAPFIYMLLAAGPVSGLLALRRG